MESGNIPKHAIHLVLLVLSMCLAGWTTATAQPVITLSSPRQLSTDPAVQLDPTISGDIVVYTDMRNGNEDIYYYDLSTGIETQITTSSANQRLHDISGSRIVYTDMTAPGSRIVLYDLATDTAVPTTVPITAGPHDQNPRIDGDIVVFERGPSGAYDVMAYDLASASETPVAATPAHEQAPVVSGWRVAYERHATPTAPGDVVVFDLDTHAEIVLGPPISTTGGRTSTATWLSGMS